MNFIRKRNGLKRCIKRILIMGYGKESVKKDLTDAFVFYILKGGLKPDYPSTEKIGRMRTVNSLDWARMNLGQEEFSKLEKIYNEILERRHLLVKKASE